MLHTYWNVPNVSMMRPLSIIVAVDNRGGFCKDKKIPWNYKEDFGEFKKITKGGICVMGRNTYQEILDKKNARKKKKESTETSNNTTLVQTNSNLLPGRESYVLSRSTDFAPIGATLAKGIHDVCERIEVNDKREVFVLGGESIFIEALSWTTKIYMTVIDKDYSCDQFFPIGILDQWFMIRSGRKSGELYFVEYQRK